MSTETTYVVVLPAGWLEAPAVAAFCLNTREELHLRYGFMKSGGSSRPPMRYTEDIEVAKSWLDSNPGENRAQLVKAWRLPNGQLCLRDPAKVVPAQVFAVDPIRSY